MDNEISDFMETACFFLGGGSCFFVFSKTLKVFPIFLVDKKKKKKNHPEAPEQCDLKSRSKYSKFVIKKKEQEKGK